MAEMYEIGVEQLHKYWRPNFMRPVRRYCERKGIKVKDTLRGIAFIGFEDEITKVKNIIATIFEVSTKKHQTYVR